MGSKTKQVQTPYQNTNTYTDYSRKGPDVDAYRALLEKSFTGEVEPLIQAQFDRARQRRENRLGSSYNQNIPQVARVAMQQQGDREDAADYGTLLAQTAYSDRMAKLGGYGNLAGMTASTPLQSGSSGYGTQVVQQQSPWGSIIGGALSMIPKF